MANVIIFTDNPPLSRGVGAGAVIVSYLTKTAGAYSIASHLRRLGYSVLVVDHCASVTLTGIKKIISDNKDDLLWVGLSTTFFTFLGAGLESYREMWKDSEELYFNDITETLSGRQESHKLAKGRDLIWSSPELNLIAKYCQDYYQIPLVVGGAYISSMKDGNLSNLDKNIHTVAGRAELFVEEFTLALKNKKINDLPYIVNNDKFDDVIFKENAYIYTDEDDISSDEWLPLEISRGCAFNCAFCSFDRRSSVDSYKHPKTVYEEIIRNYDKFGVTKYILMDDLYNDSKTKVREMYNQVWSKLPFEPEWVSYMRLDMIWADPDSIKIMQDSGAKMGSFGIETLHPVAGRKVGKGLGRDRIMKTLEHVKKVSNDDIIIGAFFITGLPDEPESSIIDTINWATTTNLLHSTIFAPLWITPPSHKSFVLDQNNIAKDTDKFNIRWLSDDEWVNNQGVTFTKAKELAALGQQNRKGIISTFSDYPEYRSAGWAHEQIVNFTRGSATKFSQELKKSAEVRAKRICSKLKKRLNVEQVVNN
jgi:hypothetical protein